MAQPASNADMDITRWFPNEVIEQIVQVALPADRASLCRVSKLIHDLSLPILYRTVELYEYNSAGAFCCVLIENPSRGDAIRSFSIPSAIPRERKLKRDNWHWDNWSTLEYLVTEAMKLMPRLENLVMHYLQSEPMECTFPRLATFDIALSGTGMPRWQKLVPFLRRHPNLTRLRIKADEDITVAKGTSISLLRLEHFDGPTTLIRSLMVRRLRKARLDWSCAHTSTAANSVETTVAALASLTDPGIPLLSSHEYVLSAGFEHIITSLSKHIPHTKTLRFLWLQHGSDVSDTIIDHVGHITTCLPLFTGLVYLEMHGYTAIISETETMFSVAMDAWAKACPTLQAFCWSGNIHGRDRAWKKVNENWEAYDVREFQEQAELGSSG